MKRNLLVLAIIFFIGFIVTSCVKEETEPKCECNLKHHETACTCDGVDCVCTMPQAKDITIAEGKTVTVNYYALPGATPIWWKTLEDVFHDRAAGFGTFHYTLNVEYTGTDGFVAGGVGSGRTATVSNTFLSNSDYASIRQSMGPMVAMWVAMDNGNDVFRMVGITVPKYNRATQLRDNRIADIAIVRHFFFL